LRNGSSATIFAYGQTGAGKTYTIIGGTKSVVKKASSKRLHKEKKIKLSQSDNRGILPRVIDFIFSNQVSNSDGAQGQHVGNYMVRESGSTDRKYFVSFFEVYNEKVFDLLQSVSPNTSSTPSSSSHHGEKLSSTAYGGVNS
jgi:hypothetical protein